MVSIHTRQQQRLLLLLSLVLQQDKQKQPLAPSLLLLYEIK